MGTIPAHPAQPTERTNERQRILKAKEKVALANVTNAIHLARLKEQADSAAYAKQRESEANKLRLTPEFLNLQRQSKYLQNMEMYLGSRVPTTFSMRSEGGGERGGERGGEELDEAALLSQQAGWDFDGGAT